MPNTPASPARPRPEGWFGVLVTAALCGIFLWWWFLPEPVSSATERDPLYWVGLARSHQGSAEPTLSMRLEIIMIAEALREHGESTVADRLENDWLPPDWPPAGEPETAASDGSATDSATDDPVTDAFPTDPDVTAALAPGPTGDPDPIGASLEEAAAAFDTLDIEHGQHLLQEAAQAAAALPEPARTHALWRVAARQARSGLAADAAVTRQHQSMSPGSPEFPDWLIAEMNAGDLLAPVVHAHAALPADHPRVVALASRWRALVRERLRQRDHPLFIRHGPATDASAPMPAETDTPTLWSAVESNRLGEAARLAGDDPAACLAIARLLTWLAAPPP